MIYDINVFYPYRYQKYILVMNQIEKGRWQEKASMLATFSYKWQGQRPKGNEAHVKTPLVALPKEGG